jgi:deazaflavin-dependent oxidoreductase (nitroreductase family)
MSLPKPLQPVFTAMGTRRGLHLDAWIVRITGTSLFSWLMAKHMGLPARAPTVPKASGPIAVETIGRRSGRRRLIAIAAGWLPDGTWSIVGSAGGSPKEPDWLRNLRANPTCRIWADRRRVAVRADILEGDAKEPLWSETVARAPIFAQYQERAGRDIPIVVLRPTSSSSA